MKILFIDSHLCAYDTTTHLSKPLGGTQSAVSNLSRELAAAGNKVTVVNGVENPLETDGVLFTHLPITTEDMNTYDVVILVSAVMAKTMREVGCTIPIVLWSHHASNQPCVQTLADPQEQALYAGIALVSTWHVGNYVEAFKLDPNRVRIMRNGVSPGFLETTSTRRWLKEGTPPVFGYTSTPYRGLDVLLLSFSSIRKKFEGASLRIYSGMQIYYEDHKDDYLSLYDLANSLPGVTYVGPLPQQRLAEEMANIDIWAYPCTFPETSCISAMEAMASGALLISSSLGALPETTSGHARLCSLSGINSLGMYATRFADFVTDEAVKFAADRQQAEDAIAKQIDFARETYNWKARAREWTDWLSAIL